MKPSRAKNQAFASARFEAIQGRIRRTDPADPSALVALIELLAMQEEMVSQLYEMFAEALPGQKDFWQGMARDEAVHEKLLGRVKELAGEGLLREADPNPGVATVWRSIERVRIRAKSLDSRPVTPFWALYIAHEIEEAMLEGRIAEMFETGSEEIHEALTRLHRDTRRHAREVAESIRRLNRHSQLLLKGLLTEEQLDMARRIAVREGSSVEGILASLFNVPRHEILASLANHYACAACAFDEERDLPEDLRRAVEERQKQLRSALLCPIERNGGTLAMAVENPKNVVARDAAHAFFPSQRIEFRVAIPEDILTAIDRICGVKAEQTWQTAHEILETLEDAEALQPLEQDEEEEIAVEDNRTVVKLINRIIEDAYALGASDVHIEPSRQKDTRVRYRVDGVMRTAMEVPRRYRNEILARLKIMSDLDIAERRKAQSGKIQFRRWGRLDLELRVETYPTVGGVEDAVLRILSHARPMPLEDLALGARNLGELRRLAGAPHGLFLCVGPTGSGKTTTLHSTLAHIRGEEKKILTVEDPVEITQPGLRQVQVNAKAGVTFASALRSFLRADPDVIMIGEIRDAETATIAIEASLTGHLVFSTLHTNSAAETVVRLLDIGLDPYTFADALLGVLAQRLLRTLCRECKESGKIGKEALEALRQEYGSAKVFDALGATAETRVWRPKPGGCERCNGTGFRGRMAIHELLVGSEKIAQLVCRKANAAEIRKVAIREGMQTLRQDGIAKYLTGHTTMTEVRAVCGGAG